MNAAQIAEMTGLILDSGSGYGLPYLDWDDSAVGRGKHDRRIPRATIAFEDGMRLTVGQAPGIKSRRTVEVTSRDGYVEKYEHGNAVILRAWNEAQARAILHDMGEIAPVPRDSERRRRRGWFRRSPDRTEDGPAVLRLADFVSECIVAREPVRCEDTYPAKTTGSEVGVLKYKPAKTETWRSDWDDVGYGLRIIRSGEYCGSWIDHDGYMVAHDLWGVVPVPAAPVLEALQRRRDASFASSMPTCMRTDATTGNAYADMLTSMGRRLLSVDAGIRSRNGSRIDALIERHLPRLVSAHREAARSSPNDRMVLDRDLACGLELIRTVLDQSFEDQGDEARRVFLTELRFLETRHPEALPRPDGLG